MPIIDAILPEFDHEMATTRLLLERVPAGKASWKPHAKSMDLGALCSHVADIPGWVKSTVEQESFDVAPVGGTPYVTPVFSGVAELLERFDRNVREARAAFAGKSDAALMVKWSLLSGGQEVFSMPRVGVIRTFLLNHLIHHRGQLTVYLRMCDVPLPSVYGPSADTPGM